MPKPVKAILSLYGAVDFANPVWKNKPLPGLKAILPDTLTPDFLNKVYSEFPVPTDNVISLEGQTDLSASSQSNDQGERKEGPPKPNFSLPRDAFAFTHLANGTILDAIYPKGDVESFDPLFNLSPSFPPTYIVHGMEDMMVPTELSRRLYARLQENGVECGMTEVPGEGHTFAAKMEVGTRTWDLQREGFEFLDRVLKR